eukprot:g953.t1
MYEFDLIVIGAGSGGTRAARFAAANYNAKVAIIELPFGFISSDTVGGAGGTCVIRGCVPKKLLVYASHYAEDFEDSVGFGWSASRPPHSWKSLVSSKGTEVQRLNGVYNKLLSGAGVRCFEGKGRLLDAHTVHVSFAVGGEQRITGKTILISTGSKAVKLDIPGKEYCITSDEALALDDLPPESTVAIVGGGYIAVEFSGIFNGLGASVHLLYRKPFPLRGFDQECRERVAENLTLRGVNLHPNCQPQQVVKNGDQTYTLHYTEADGSTQTIQANFVMFATGRKPYFKDLGLENAGIAIENGVIQVNDISQTNIDNIYAIGDVTSRMDLTPVALMEAMAFVKTIFGGERTSPDYSYVPSAVFCQPPLATVGYTEEKAIQTFSGELDVFHSNFRPMKNTLCGRVEKTIMKIIVHVETDKVVGVHMVGPDAAEIMQGIAIAIKAGATKAAFDSTVGIHPSSAEEFVTMRQKTRRVMGTGMAQP